MRVYKGRRTPDGCVVTVHDGETRGKALRPRLGLRNHSPTGFEWGYGGSGPAQLALALLADCLGDDDRALDLYQAFKFAVVGKLEQEGWTLTEQSIARWVDENIAPGAASENR